RSVQHSSALHRDEERYLRAILRVCKDLTRLVRRRIERQPGLLERFGLARFHVEPVYTRRNERRRECIEHLRRVVPCAESTHRTDARQRNRTEWFAQNVEDPYDALHILEILNDDSVAGHCRRFDGEVRFRNYRVHVCTICRSEIQRYDTTAWRAIVGQDVRGRADVADDVKLCHILAHDRSEWSAHLRIHWIGQIREVQPIPVVGARVCGAEHVTAVVTDVASHEVTDELTTAKYRAVVGLRRAHGVIVDRVPG